MYRFCRSLIMIWLCFGLLITVALLWGRLINSPVLSFIATRDDVDDIYLYDTRTGHSYNLTDSIEPEWNMSWSQNPIALGYHTRPQLGSVDDSYTIMSRLGKVMSIDITQYGSAYSTILAPNSQYIAHFASFPGEETSDIYLTDVSERSTYNLTQTSEQFEMMPRWSPEGLALLFLRDSNLYHFDIASQQEQLLLDYDLGIEDMFWSSDAEKIAFYSNVLQDGRYIYQLHTINADGTALRTYQLESEPRSEALSWSPDSCCIVLGLASGDLAIIDLESHNTQYLTGEARRFAPVWSPDGSWIAFIENRRIHLLDLHSNHIQSIDKAWRIRVPMHWMP